MSSYTWIIPCCMWRSWGTEQNWDSLLWQSCDGAETSVGVLISSDILILGTEFLPVNCWGSVHCLTNVSEALPRISGCIMCLFSLQ